MLDDNLLRNETLKFDNLWVNYNPLKNCSVNLLNHSDNSFRELGAAYPCDEWLCPLRRNCCSLLLYIMILNISSS